MQKIHLQTKSQSIILAMFYHKTLLKVNNYDNLFNILLEINKLVKCMLSFGGDNRNYLHLNNVFKTNEK